MTYSEQYQPGLSVDCAIFGFHDNELKVLVLKMKNVSDWALPGGFIAKDETLDDAAIRVLKKRTSLKDIYLEQFKTFGGLDRMDQDHVDLLLEEKIISPENESWFRSRFVTVGYFALVEFSKVEPQPDPLSELCEWVSLNEMPNLFLDHQRIVREALKALRLKLRFQPIGKELLPKKFTMTELRTLYETILGTELDRRNFQRKMLSFGILDKLNETRKGGAHKAPFLYSFNEKKYNQTVKKGFSTIW